MWKLGPREINSLSHELAKRSTLLYSLIQFFELTLVPFFKLYYVLFDVTFNDNVITVLKKESCLHFEDNSFLQYSVWT